MAKANWIEDQDVIPRIEAMAIRIAAEARTKGATALAPADIADEIATRYGWDVRFGMKLCFDTVDRMYRGGLL